MIRWFIRTVGARVLTRWSAATAVFTLQLALACGPAHSPGASNALQELRASGKAGNSQESAQWLLAELLEPGGDPKAAQRARKRLDESGKHGLYEDLARGVDDSVHGRLSAAPAHYLRAAKAARTSTDPAAPLFAQFAIDQAMNLRSNTQGLWKEWQSWVEATLDAPGNLGWRTRDALLDWWSDEAWSAAAKDVDQVLAKRLGCLRKVRLAGPFGNGEAAELVRAHAAEAAEPWPVFWPQDPVFGNTPRVLKTEQESCLARAEEDVGEGVFYAEAVFELAAPTRVILTANRRALKLWVDDEVVLERDPRAWGSATFVGAGVELAAGKHRVLARLPAPEAALRVLREDGTPQPLLSEPDGLRALGGVQAKFEANAVRSYIHERGVRPVDTAILRYVTAHLAHADGESGAATLLLEPLVKDTNKATGPALSIAAEFVAEDPIYDSNQVDDLIRQLHEQALKRDAGLWASQLNRVAHVARSRGLADAVEQLRELTRQYHQVPDLLGALAKVYEELGWIPEYRRTVKARAERFPDDVEGLEAAVATFEEEGDQARVKELQRRIVELDPDSEILVQRAIAQRRYDQAIAELERLRARRPERKDLEQRIAELKARSGTPVDAVVVLQKAVERSPKSGAAHLNLADALYAAGDPEALSKGLVKAIEAGADADAVKSALDLVSGVTELDPYRLNTQQVIKEYEARAEHLPGTAARVLDYMAVWALSDGSSRILEHEIIRIQSEEAKTRFAEQEPRGDTVLKMRVIKQDGRILEPETVEGKPTVTFSHLDIGDYIETEEVFGTRPSQAGVSFDGPQWFFREKDVAYARSEFVLISAADRKLDIEITGDLPEAQVTQDGAFTVRRWRVEKSPAASDEPFSVPPQEYLPSVKVSWGMGLPRHLATLTSRAQDLAPMDPRIVRVARRIVEQVPAARELDRARLLYRWVLDNVQDGEEADGRRVIIGKRGNRYRAFMTLCRALDIPVHWVVARNRLAPPPKGPADEAEQYGATVLRVGGQKTAWAVLVDKYLPFGYLPPEVRGASGYLLEPQKVQPITVPAGGERDRLEFLGEVQLKADGGAELKLEQVFAGKFGAGLRQALSELGERRTRDAIEGQILGSNLRGARLTDYELGALEKFDEPLRLHMRAQMAHFALSQAGGKELRLDPPYTFRLSQFAALPSRQTAILLPTERNWHVRIQLELPAGSRVELPPPTELKFGDHRVRVRDRMEGKHLVLEREVVLSAGRITPDRYAEFVRFTRAADSALTREITIKL